MRNSARGLSNDLQMKKTRDRAEFFKMVITSTVINVANCVHHAFAILVSLSKVDFKTYLLEYVVVYIDDIASLTTYNTVCS